MCPRQVNSPFSLIQHAEQYFACTIKSIKCQCIYQYFNIVLSAIIPNRTIVSRGSAQTTIAVAVPPLSLSLSETQTRTNQLFQYLPKARSRWLSWVRTGNGNGRRTEAQRATRYGAELLAILYSISICICDCVCECVVVWALLDFRFSHTRC